MASSRARLMTMSDLLLAMLRRQAPDLRVQTFHEGNFAVAAGVVAAFTPIVSFTLPIGMQGQLERYTYGCEVLSDFDRVVWQVRIDGSPIPNHDFIQGPNSTFVFPNTLAAPIPLRGGGTVDIAARLATAGVPILGEVAAVVTGTFWPQQGPDQQVDLTGHVTAQL